MEIIWKRNFKKSGNLCSWKERHNVLSFKAPSQSNLYHKCLTTRNIGSPKCTFGDFKLSYFAVRLFENKQFARFGRTCMTIKTISIPKEEPYLVQMYTENWQSELLRTQLQSRFLKMGLPIFQAIFLNRIHHSISKINILIGRK